MMRKHRIRNTSLEVSALCLGTAGIGWADSPQSVDVLFNAFRDAGGNFLDTAHCYAAWRRGDDGASERAVADYFRRNGGREQFIVATKGGHPGFEDYRKVDLYLSPGRVSADIDDSLARLDCDRIDLYYLHRDDVRLMVAEIIDHLNEEIGRGRIAHIAASNWSIQRLEEAELYAASRGRAGFVMSQPRWSLAEVQGKDPKMVTIAPADVTWHRRTGLPVAAYSPNAGGYFATGGRRGKDYDSPANRARLERAVELAGRLGCTAGQVALAYLMNQGFPVIPILGTKDAEHLREEVGACEITLSAEQVRWLYAG